MILRLLPALSLALAFALPAAGAVVTEADAQFSRHWKEPTVIGAGVETIIGTAEKQNGHEFLALTGLAPGRQTLSFDFSVPAWARTSDSYSAGGQILWSVDPFRHAWDGTSAGSFQLGRWSPESRLDLVLGDDFSGYLQLGIYFTHGRDVSWQLSLPVQAQAAAPAAVPVPAAGVHAVFGVSMLAGLALFGNRQRLTR